MVDDMQIPGKWEKPELQCLVCPELQAWDMAALPTNQSVSPRGRGLSDLHYYKLRVCSGAPGRPFLPWDSEEQSPLQTNVQEVT